MRIFSFILGFLILIATDLTAQHQKSDAIKSPYVGQEHQAIKSLTPQDIEGLKIGSGMPFNGMAKPAELNGYPGPRHVLDAYETGEFELTDIQFSAVDSLFNSMQQKAIPLGKKIISIEKKLDFAFQNKNINPNKLQKLLLESSEVYAQLRFVHLNAHLSMMDILDEDQISTYNKLRGYTLSDDPCENIPEGHDPDMWKKHNGCN